MELNKTFRTVNPAPSPEDASTANFDKVGSLLADLSSVTDAVRDEGLQLSAMIDAERARLVHEINDAMTSINARLQAMVSLLNTITGR